MSDNIQIWYRRSNESKYHIIKESIDRKNNQPILSWDRNISNKLFEFTIYLWNPIDEFNLPIKVKEGDEIVITDWLNRVYSNTFIGIIEEIKIKYIGIDESGTSANKSIEMKIKNKDFSTEELTIEKITSTYINDLLPQILVNTPDLGGVKLNGLIIPKHDYGGENFLIPPFSMIGSQFDLLIKIMDLIGWAFVFYYYSESDPINGLHIIKQLSFFPKNVGFSTPDDWGPGITFEIWKNGMMENPNSYYDDTLYIFGEKEITYSKKNTQTKNSIKLKLNTKDINTTDGIRLTINAISGQDTYDIGGCFDIKSIAIQIITTITTISSSTVFTIPSVKASAIGYYQTRMNDNALGGVLRCKIKSGSTEYIRDFSLNLITNTVTLSSEIVGLTAGDEMELIGCYDILPANLTSYPPEGNGYIIKTLDVEKSTIKFTKYDAPETGSIILVYYYPITQTYKTKKDETSISLVGFRGVNEVIKEPITLEQSNQIFAEYEKILKPLEEVNLLFSHRKSILEINCRIPVDFEDIKGNFIVTESSGKILSENGLYKNRPLIIQDIKIASYKNNIDDVLAKIKNNSIALANMNLTHNIEEILLTSIDFNIVDDSALDLLIIPILINTSNITQNSFLLTFMSSNTNTYLLDVSTTSDFSSGFIYQNKSIGAIASANTETGINIDSLINYTYPIYVRLRAIRGTEISGYSNILNVGNSNDLQSDSNTLTFLKFQNNYLDETVNHKNATPVNSPNFGAGIITGDTHSLILDGSNDYLEFVDDFDFSTTQEFTFRIVFQELLNTITASYKALFYIYDITIGSNQVLVGCYYDQNYFYFTIYSWDYNNNGTNSTYNFSNFKFARDIIQNSANIMQIAFKQSTRDFKAHLNGIEKTVIWNTGNYTLLNILANWARKSPLRIGAYKDLAGINHGDLAFPNIKLARFSVDKIYRDSVFALQDAKNLKLYRELEIDIDTIISFRLQENTGTMINSTLPAIKTGTLNGTLSGNWVSGTLINDTSSLKLNGTNNYINTSNYLGTITDFTIRTVLRFNTGEKSSKSFHPIFSKYDSTISNGAGCCLISEYQPSSNKIVLYIYDSTDNSSSYNMRYFTANIPTAINENQDYFIQIAFKLSDSNNSNLNTCEISLNGSLLSGYWTNSRIGFTNITNIKNSNQDLEIGSYKYGVREYAKYQLSRLFFDLRFRTSSEALIDAQNLGLA